MDLTITPVILGGGSGTRLWPRSRASRPKPFLPLVGDEVPFAAALNRCRGNGFGAPIVVAGAAHADLVFAHLAAGEAREVILEPEAKQTAAAIALAALRLPKDALMLVCPSDHHVGDSGAFLAAARAAARAAAEGYLVSVGVAAHSPETRFGYIKVGEAVVSGAFAIEEFVEKPDRPTAEEYLRRGGFVWNAGIFAFRAGEFISQLSKHRPKIAECVAEAVATGQASAGRFWPDAAAFARIDPESVDYAVMENTDRAAVVVAQMDWSDLGDWPALRRARDRDRDGNALRGPVEAIGCRNVLGESDGPRVKIVGLEDVVVVVDGDEILVAGADSTDAIGKLGKAAE